MTVPDFKREFLRAEGCYANCAYMGPVPLRAVEAGHEAIRREAAPSKITAEHFFSHVAAIRQEFAYIVGAAHPDSIAVFPAVSYGLATVARNLGRRSGNIVLVENEMPTNYYVWRHLELTGGYKLRVVSRPADVRDRADKWSQSIIDVIDRETVLVSLSTVHWIDGTTSRLDKISKKARSVGAQFIVDGTQSLGVALFPMDEIRPDAVLCAGYKWLLGPYSLSLGYFGERYRDGVPLEHHWLARKRSEDFANLTKYEDQFRAGAIRFDAGESSNFILAPMLLASLGLINEIGVARIAGYVGELTKVLREAAEAYGWSVSDRTQSAPHYFTVPVKEVGREASELLARLKRRSITLSVRGENVRVTPHICNDMADMRIVVEALSEYRVAA